MATMKDVAENAGVSVATVSAVINKDSGVNVSERLTKRVEKAVKELNYRPNRIARALSRKETHTLAYIVPTIDNNFFSQMAKYIEDMAFEKGYSVYLCNTESKADRLDLYMQNLLENRVDGIITTLTWEISESNFIETVNAEGIPIVGLAGARIVDGIDTVTIGDLEGARIATNHLLKKGYSKIGFIGVKESKTTQERLAGFKRSLQEANIDFNDEYVKLGSGFSRRQGFELTEKLVNNHPELTAIFVYNDVMAAGVIDKLNQLKINIPEDIAVIGFDDSVATYVRPKLTTMALPKEKMSKLAIDMLFERMEKKESELYHTKVIPKLIKRKST
ncbi:transcriptional regulator [Halobacteroides halobius DSM 5150]|uniref:Transcriptional regulator n=1 Tax=Halobacteroides halobius (strain ATCC 35273 / DSM 5150 / MD-1) TaxID=748449 RepID=L0KBA7_HALHC|nr:LacI family DNA-binding transcriptional regulator [Halobacteroides halobius]AGB41669.1 transcriptional regulator [Halobacteroides halobius DSM 5150]